MSFLVVFLILMLVITKAKADFKDIYPQIINLPEIIHSFSKLNCLVHIDNYKNLNLKPSGHPIILRKLDVTELPLRRARFKFPGEDGFKLSLTSPHSKNPINCALNESSTFRSNCSYVIKGFMEIRPSVGFCTCLNKPRFVVKTKPWNFQVHIELYPDHDQWINPKIFQNNVISSRDMPMEYNDQSIQPQTIILIDIAAKRNWFFRKWMTSLLIHSLANDTFGSGAIIPRFLIGYPKNIRRLEFELNGDIIELHLTEHCSNCRVKTLFGMIPMSQPLKQQSILPYMAHISITNPNGGFAYETHQRWGINAYGDERSGDNRIFQGINRQFQACPNNFSKRYLGSMKSLAKIPVGTPHEKMFHAMARLMQETAGNASFPMARGNICFDGKIYKYTEELDPTPTQLWTHLRINGEPSNRSLYGWLSLPTNVTNLRFVSCGGNRGMYDLAFAELVNVYEYRVWVFIIASSVSLALTIEIVKKETLSGSCGINSFKYLLNVAKVLIEQGDPFLRSVVINLHLRSAVGGFLLVGIILSNAYKSTNVYNMIKERRYIPYETFHELVENNFTIYTRTAYMHIDIGFIRFRMEGKNHTIRSDSHVIYLTKVPWNSLRSEVLQWSSAAKSGATDLWKILVNHTSLHPKLEQMIWDLISPYRFSPDKKWLYHHPSYSGQLDHVYFPNAIWKNESELLYGELRKCTKMAVVATESQANEYGRKLQMEGKKDVYVGREVYSNLSISLSLSGVVKPQVQWRMKALVASGLWNWWPQFIQKSSTFMSSETRRSIEDERPNMSGNILLIFLLFMFGILGGLILFSLEYGPVAYGILLRELVSFYKCLIHGLGGIRKSMRKLVSGAKMILK